MIFSTILQRINEPSTWSGIAILLALLGIKQPAIDAVTTVGATVAATASVFLREQK